MPIHIALHTYHRYSCRMTSKPTTLITGASKRIGATLALHLAGQGHDLVLHYRHSREETETLAAELKKMGSSATLAQADLEDIDGLSRFWDGLPPVTHLIHNVSHYVQDRFDDLTPSGLRAHLSVNIEAPLLLTQRYLRQLQANSPGNVIVLGDGYNGWTISPEFFSYAASKHAWIGLTDLLAAACAPRARVNFLALGPTIQAAWEDDERFARLAARAPLKRTNDVSEVCTAVDFLLASPGVTGQVISLANGMGLQTQRPVV